MENRICPLHTAAAAAIRQPGFSLQLQEMSAYSSAKVMSLMPS
jgi:hypothetical protein